MNRAAGVILMSPEGRVLLMQRAGQGDYIGFWDYPGGGLLEDEEPRQGAARELFEETGYRMGVGGKPLAIREKNGTQYTTFLVKCDEEFVPKLSAEHSAFAWVKPETLEELSPGPAAPTPAPAADAFDESKHPRGQPENKGQFGPGGGGGSASGPGGPPDKEAASGPRAAEKKPGKGSGGESEKEGEGEEAGRESAPAASLFNRHAKSTKTVADIVEEQKAGSAIEHARERLKSAVPTNSLVSEGGHMMPSGKYTPERQKVHAKILKAIFTPEAMIAAKAAPGKKPMMTMLGGRGGSGKSWLTGKDGPVNRKTSMLIDSDYFKSVLPGYEGWNAAVYHEEATHLVDVSAALAIKHGLNIVHDATLKNGEGVSKRILQYKAAGYEVEGHYMYASPEVATGRALGRFMRGGKTGRFVPPEVVMGNTTNEANFDKSIPQFAKWSVWDNDDSTKGPILHAQG